MQLIRNNKNKKDCGIVAAFNASRLCGQKKTYSDIEKIAKSCGYSKRKGIYDFQFFYLMKKMNISIKSIRPKSTVALRSSMYKGKCFIFLYTPTGFDCGHVILTFMDHKGFIRIINPDKDRRSWSAFVTDIRDNGMKNFKVYEISSKTMAK